MKLLNINESTKENYNKATETINRYWRQCNTKLHAKDEVNKEYAAYFTYMFNKLWRTYSNV